MTWVPLFEAAALWYDFHRKIFDRLRLIPRGPNTASILTNPEAYRNTIAEFLAELFPERKRGAVGHGILRAGTGPKKQKHRGNTFQTTL